MSINLNKSEVEIRENRNYSIISYTGTAKNLCHASDKKCLKCYENFFNQCGDCSAQRAFLQVALIKDAAVVNHAPIGCAADFSLFNAQKRTGLKKRGAKILDLNALSTNIEEKDTIYGASNKLEITIKEAYKRYNPKAIFVTASCASGIIGEDIETVVNSTEKELGIPVVPIYCEGFKSKVWTSGSDAVYHGVLRKIVKPAKKRRTDLINIINFSDRDSYGPLLAKIGLKANYILPLSSISDIEKISEAAATGHICETLSTYMAKGLEQEFGVPEIKSPPPYGIDWTDLWLREIGKITNKEKLVEKVIKEEKEGIKLQLVKLREKLNGKKVYIACGSSFGHSLISIATDLGMKVIGEASIHHHQKFDTEDQIVNSLKNMIKKYGDVENYLVCNKQPYQIVNILRTLKPDLLMLRHETLGSLGVKLGIPTYFANDANICIGYDGVIGVGEDILKIFDRKHLLENISQHCKLPYTDWWFEQNASIFQGGVK
ncbi:nitrogenase component 1 [Clostridium kluyveri]|uniref:nitrogenase component 1 n=1 Tax=Clostridium kluyveri TaxID=1534 RepID=UPI0022470677|nr:nitrogenase component 1 [Clostridium kluyveri]UZQ49490.1 nitrogenase [Clostridium kluyveri]